MSDLGDPRVPPAGTPEAAAAVAPVAAPLAAEAPVVAPAAEVAIVAPAAEAPVVAPAIESPPASGTQPTLMEQFDRQQAEKDKPSESEDPKAEEAKPPEKEGEKAEEKKPDAEPEKPADSVKSPEAAAEAPKAADAPVVAPPAAEPFKFEAKLPDGITMSDERRGEVESVLGDFIATPTAENQARLLDLHKTLVEENLNTYYQHWLDQFNATQREWEKQVRDDPIIGGGNHDEAMQAMAYVRDNFVSLAPRGSKEYVAAQKGFNEVLYRTGMGSNPYFLHMLHNVSQVLNEPKMVATSEIKPMPAQINSNGRPSIYKHPTSFRNGR